ncbi:MAG TPA: hypothetical protein VEW69_07905 [Alphaproteobacteria bacterium]|nr:hypothetical protein [Alphaproteobacteria bacterium]
MYVPQKFALAKIGWLILFASIGLRAQVSPGPVARAHQSIAGVTQCTACHKLGTGGRALKCMDCHTEIHQRLTAGLGFHAAVVKKEAAGNDCARCHSEHNGEDFRLVRWEPSQEKFDHTKTGYALEGKHAGLTCRQCHTAARIQEPLRSSIRYKDLNKSFLGLSRECLSCHNDFHHGQLSKRCQDCHNTVTWKDVSSFDHAKTRYPLTGEHAKVACAKCHKPIEPGQTPKYTGINFASCAACHADPHHGAFQRDCASCHVTLGWKHLSSAGLSSQFDHDKTNYPLRGKHRALDCSTCHHSGNFKQPVAHALCIDCHKDPHSGQFAKRKDGGKCESCHVVEGFKPAKYTVQDHATSAYPLEGSHAKVECGKCHIPAGAATKYKIKFAHCLDCHQDAHGAQFAAAPLLNRCESCHSVKTFAPSTFTLVKHKQTKFPLSGAHIAVPCADCHAAKKPSPTSTAPYHFAELTCTTCHEDVHHDQFKKQMARKQADGHPAGCEACHSVNDWRDLTKFDHDQTEFKLVGSHKGVACIECHKPSGMETTMRHVSFNAALKTCEGCHEDPHGRQFAKNGVSPTCDQCHQVLKWKPSLFDHEKTAFSLRGAHQQLRCSACHKDVRTMDGKQVLFYMPTPKECAACHGPNVTG